MLTRGGTQAQKEEVLSMMKELETKGGEFKVSLTSAECSAQYNQALQDKEHVVADMTKELDLYERCRVSGSTGQESLPGSLADRSGFRPFGQFALLPTCRSARAGVAGPRTT
ncbi:MAG: hypothetical protein IPO90_07620 [Flavobacteriales bacterium]|nr:hypothetical protein [Flavobacteriales bacterium]